MQYEGLKPGVKTLSKGTIFIEGGVPLPCDIPIWPTGIMCHAGEQLRLTVTGFNPIPFHLPGIPGPVTRNKGDHIIHTGGDRDSYLLVPKTPS